MFCETLYDLIVGKPKLTVDYDSPNDLLLNMESSKWLECAKRVESYPEEAETWISRRDKLDEEIWRMLPIHAAIMFKAPAFVIASFLKACPNGAKEKNSNEQLPIHTASQRHDPDDEVISVLLESYPDSINKEDPNGGISLADYNRNCTELYNAIENRHWKYARRRAKYYPSEVKTWIIKRDENGKIMERNLCIHAAVAHGAPLYAVKQLLKSFPESAKYVDNLGMTPLLHELKKEHRNEVMIGVLSKSLTYPEGVVMYRERGEMESLISDFDINCTILYEYILKKDWNNVIRRAISNPEEVHTWVMYSKEKGELCWRHLPLHAALQLQASCAVIDILLTSYLDSIRACDDRGLIPFQIALNNYCRESDVVKTLLEALENRKSICVKNSKGQIYLTNYENNSLKLYQYIESKDWENCIKYAKMYPEDAKTWIMRNEKNGRLRWRLLPIHAALILQCPSDVVETLLNVYPDGAKFRDDMGMLPVQIAMWKNLADDIIMSLVVAYPEGDMSNALGHAIPFHRSPTLKSKTTAKRK